MPLRKIDYDDLDRLPASKVVGHFTTSKTCQPEYHVAAVDFGAGSVHLVDAPGGAVWTVDFDDVYVRFRLDTSDR